MNGTQPDQSKGSGRARFTAAIAGAERIGEGLLERYLLPIWRVLFRWFIVAFPRPQLPDEDKNRVATVVADFFAIGVLYNASEFLLLMHRWTVAGIQAYCLYIATLLLIRYHAVKGRLRFAAVLYCASVTYFYMAQTIDFGYFEHLQATNFLLVVAFSTIALGPLAGAVALAATLGLFWGLVYLSKTGGLVPLSTLLPDIASPLRQESRMINENLIEIYLFCWLVRAHIYSQLQTSLTREKEEAARAAKAHEVADKAERQRLQYLLHVNHELRNPLVAIVTSIDMLSQEYNRAVEQKTNLPADPSSHLATYIRTISTTSHHVQSVLNDVLDMERLEGEVAVPTVEAFSVRALIKDVSEIYAMTATEAGNALSTRVAGGLFDQWIGPTSRIRQVLLNLVSNAIKHAPESNIVLSVSQAGQGLVFEVSDTGPGLSDHARAHLFEPFASSLGAKGSTGLGLRICKLIVENQLHGSIEVRSEKGLGTAFTVMVPLQMGSVTTQGWEYVEPSAVSTAAPLVSSSSEPQQSVAALAGKSLLLVDDDEDNLEVMSMALEDVGMTVKTAQTSQQALDILRDGHFDVTLLDYNLGPKSECDGMQLAMQIVGGTAGSVVGYTGNMSANLEHKWQAAGVKLILRKPVSVKTLTSTLLEATS